MVLAWFHRIVAACSIVLLPLAVPAYSQETTGTILGALVDETGAVLPGVKVVITSVDTGYTRELVTNQVGQYAESLPVGMYEIRFLLPRFQPFIARGISLHVNDRLQVNAKLIVGGAIETLTVTAQRLVQPTAAVQYLIQANAIRDLPLRTRTLVQLVTLVPGVSSDLREDACFCDQGNLNISINGARRSAVNWLLDGANNVNSWDSYTAITTPSLEALQEINVITSSYSAEWARNGGGVVNAVTRSGTSRFSGSAYHFARNDALNANSFFRNMDPRADVNDRPPRLRYNNFGYTLGGPVLPTRRKLFFFLSQEWRRSTSDKMTIEAPVPDPAWLTDPTSAQYVAPAARDPNAVKLLPLWPAPNVPGTNWYRTTITNELDTRQEFVKVDYSLSTDWSLAGRYLHDGAESLGEYVATPTLEPGRRDRIGHLAVVEARRAGRRWLQELSYQMSSHDQVRHGFAETRERLGIQIPEIFSENSANLLPRLLVIGVAEFEQPPISQEHLTQVVSSAMTLQHHAHRLKAGGLISLESANSNLFDDLTQGLFVFLPGGGFTAFQNFLRGNTDGACGDRCRYLERDIDVHNRLRSRRYELFIQDTWRVHPRLTLDGGLRYAFYPPVTDDRNMLFTYSAQDYDPAQAPAFADADGNLLAAGTGNLFNGIRIAGKNSPHGQALYEADRNNLQPRLGAAWDPRGTDRFIVRAGYGIYFDQTKMERFAYSTQEPRNNPLRTEVSIDNPSLSNPARGSVVASTTVPAAYSIGISDPFLAPRWQHWNIGMQARLYSRGVLDFGYVGSRGDNLLRLIDINQPQPADLVGHGRAPNTVRPFRGYDSIFIQESTAKSRYHGLVAGFRHEAGRGGTVTASYTLSRNMADATYDHGAVDDPQNPNDKAAEFAEAITDRAHIFTASYIYELPFGRDGANGWRKALFAGWQIAGATWIESGPTARIEVVNFNYDDGFFPSVLRPDQVGNAAGQTRIQWFNPAAFVPSPAGEYGRAPVVPFRLPGRHQWDIAISKTMNLVGTARLQLRADFINAFNHTQFLDVNTTCVGTTSCDTEFGFGNVTSTRRPREIQLGIRLDW